MRKLIFVTGFFCLASTTCQLRAQSIINKSWKTYIGAPINDTAIFNISPDSSLITNTKGQVMVRFHSKISGDTITVLDYGVEEQGCPDIKGTYNINMAGDSFTLTMVNDECDGRSQALVGRTWVKTTRR